MAGDIPEIQCRVILEVLGKPKEHVEESLKKYLEAIEKDGTIKVIKKEIAEAEVVEGLQEGVEYYTTFAELEFTAKDFSSMFSFCFNYMPSSLEIIKPENLFITNKELSNMMNDLQARSHDVDKVAKELRSEVSFLKRNVKNLIKNIVLISLKLNSLDLDTLSRGTGINEEELKPFLEELVKEDRIEKRDEVYCLK